MRRRLCLITICLMTITAICQSTSNYQVATIVDVTKHQTGGADAAGPVSYDVSVKVGDTIYVVLYTPPMSVETVKYAAGRSLLVAVGAKTITYHDLLGQSFEVQILSKRPAAK